MHPRDVTPRCSGYWKAVFGEIVQFAASNAQFLEKAGSGAKLVAQGSRSYFASELSLGGLAMSKRATTPGPRPLARTHDDVHSLLVPQNFRSLAPDPLNTFLSRSLSSKSLPAAAGEETEDKGLGDPRQFLLASAARSLQSAFAGVPRLSTLAGIIRISARLQERTCRQQSLLPRG